MQSCKDDDLILTGQPSWLGNSIYERLQDEGTYKYTLRLIDDLGEKEVLSHTGSRTLFVAADTAYESWFKTNDWGVRKYEDLTLPQKRLLLKNSMIDNAYLLELMSNQKAEGDAATPEWGKTMRRTTSASYYDSVYVMTPAEMPETPYWESLREADASIRILKDATVAPMIHFLPAYLQNHKITAEDLKILTNQRATSLNEAWVNGVKVVNSGDPEKKKIDYDVTCKNGYIQKVEQVIQSSPNMAEIIHTDKTTSIWSHLLDRFSTPYYSKALTEDYNSNFKNSERLYTLRYASKSYWEWASNGGNKVTIERDAYKAGSTATKFTFKDELKNQTTIVPYDELLRYDPGWNQYVDNNNDNTMYSDAGMMIVPTDEAFTEWWNGNGKELQDEYGSLDNVPTSIIAELINVNMVNTFSTFVPSKFGSVLNDAKEPLGVTKDDVVGCYMGCNGVVYKVNKLFTPALFSSVAYPALAHASTMNIIYNIIDAQNFKAYLLSMDSKYALILPSNNAMMTFFDPASFGRSATDEESGVKMETPYILSVTFDQVKQEIKVERFKTTVDEVGEIIKGESLGVVNASKFMDRLYTNIMDQLIIVIPDHSMTLEKYVAQGYKYFKTKGGSLMKVTNHNGKLSFQGGWQAEHDVYIPAEASYDKDNGKSYEIETMVPMSAQKSVYVTLQEHPEFSSFLLMMENDYATKDNGAEFLSNKLNNKYSSGLSWVGNKNLRLLDNYNYTVYVPTNESIKALQDKKILPSEEELDREGYEPKTGADPKLDSLCLAEGWYEESLSDTKKVEIRKKVATTIGTVLSNFIRYHIQDHSVAIGMAPEVDEDGNYINNTSFETMKRNTETGRFVPVEVSYNNSSMTVTDKLGNTRHVKTEGGLYNLLCREYWFDGDNSNMNAPLFMTSDAVVHQIDGVLAPETMKPWRNLVKEALGIE